ILDNGMPFTVTNGATYPNGDYNADNNGGDRPNAPVTAIQTSDWSRQQFVTGVFQVADFPKPTLGTDGNLGPRTYRGPGYVSTDLSVAKKIPIAERFNALFRLDAYNAFKRVNLNNPTGDLNSSNFGKVTSTQSPRLLQVGVKLSF